MHSMVKAKRIVGRQTILNILVMILFIFSASLSSAQGTDITPNVAKKLKDMSLSKQRALANQVGLSLPAGTGLVGADDLEQLELLGEKAVPLAEVNQQNAPGVPSTQQIMLPEFFSIPEEQVFGRTLFSADATTFALTDDAVLPNNYRLGIGDILNVQLFGTELDDFSLRVGRDGTVSFPKLGPISVAGLIFESAVAAIDEVVAEQLIGVEAVITLGRMRAIGIFIAGEVETQGAYSVSALTTITQALHQAGGLTDIGSLRAIQVRRDGHVVATFDAYDLLLRGDATNDIRLESGDVLFVPPTKAVAKISGEVAREGLYEIKTGETVGDLLDMAGGASPKSFLAASTLTTVSLADGSLAALNLDLTDEKDLSHSLRNGDEIQISSIGDRIVNSVEVLGAVNRPGQHGWTVDLRISDVLGNAELDLLPTADLSYSLVIRKTNDALDIEVIQFSLREILSGRSPDLLLEDQDQILVFSLPEASAKSELSDEIEKSSNALASLFLSESLSTEEKQLLSEATLAELVALDSEILRSHLIKERLVLDDEAPDHSRAALLAPVLRVLQTQASEAAPSRTVAIRGAVKASGTYPMVKDYTIGDLLIAAGGLDESADLRAVELRRIVESTELFDIDYRKLDFTDPLVRQNYKLKPRDTLTIQNIANWSPSDSVTISGSVKYPGTYLIAKGERLSSLIDRAGGLLKTSAPEAAILQREAIKAQEKRTKLELGNSIIETYASRMLTSESVFTDLEDVEKIVSKITTAPAQGRLIIDLVSALDGSSAEDVELRAGDQLSIPEKSNTVSIFGEVRQPGVHVYQPLLEPRDYIAMSAGATKRADLKGTYIMRANGSTVPLDESWFAFKESIVILPGDSIVVPIDTAHREGLAEWATITEVVYRNVVTLAALSRL